MKRTITALFAATAGMTAAAPAFAHPGEHADIHLGEAAAHILHSPFHLAGIAAGTLIVAAIVWKVAAKR
ncbi:hypothetical protein [Roseibium aggregatum]|uniref:Uncharacterized protein n=1 Tax=Roseibium aggregatum TaxID=187304 RepID=A0A926NWF2_9HYPH|nr:hypothetical protein [Roseibium aggregatum]MBD1545596.1 hypothetical protein [Roseibium aggregatum]